MTIIGTNILPRGDHYRKIRLSKEATDEKFIEISFNQSSNKWYDKTFAIYSQLLYFIFVVVVICGKVAHTQKRYYSKVLLQFSFIIIFATIAPNKNYI